MGRWHESDPSEGIKEVTLRIRNKYDAGLSVVTEIDLLGDLPPAGAAPALVDAAKLTLNHDERQAFVSACKKLAIVMLAGDTRHHARPDSSRTFGGMQWMCS